MGQIDGKLSSRLKRNASAMPHRYKGGEKEGGFRKRDGRGKEKVVITRKTGSK